MPRPFSIIPFFLISALFLIQTRYAPGAERNPVLVIHSFHQSLPWSKGLMDGISEVLTESDLNVELHVEYLDSLRIELDDKTLDATAAFYLKKYENVSLGCILTFDDIALDFVLERRDILFPDVPLVFCAPNRFSVERFADYRERSRITGVVESVDYEGTIDLALTLLPETRIVAVVSDRASPVSRIRLSNLASVAPAFRERVSLRILTNESLAALKKEIRELPKHSVVLYLNFLADRDGRRYGTGVEVLEELVRSSFRPFFTYKTVDMGRGAVGGRVVSERTMAREAARMVVQVLKGRPANDIPIRFRTPTVTMIDYQMAKFHRIDLRRVPEGATLINRPRSFYQEYKPLLVGAALIITLLLVLVIFLSINVIRRKNAEKRLSRAKDELERRVMERTAELADANESLTREIRERKATEKALLENEIKFRSIFHLSPQAIALSEPETGRLIDVNDHFRELIGGAKEEVIGRTSLDLALYPRVEDRERFVAELTEKGRVEGLELDFRHRDGRRINILMFARMIRIKGNAVILTILIDVTRRNLVERELQKTRRMEAIATLAGGVAHQFNNALQSITGNLDLLTLRHGDNPALMKRIDAIRQSALRMKHLTGQLLAYARGGRYAPRLLTMNALVEDALAVIRHQVPDRIDLKADLRTDARFTEVDIPQMQMAISGIINNAVEAIDGRGVITVTSGVTELDEADAERLSDARPGRFLFLEISDTGKGMDAEVRARIFEPFFTTNFQGRGLGMAAVYGIVRNHRGWIRVASEPGRGSAVTIYLPESESHPALPAPNDIAWGRNDLPKAASGVILLIEDEEMVLEVAAVMLETMGYEVVKAEDGRKAADLVRNSTNHFDLVILDIVLPDIHGRELFDLIRQARPDLRVVVSSGYSLDGPAQELLDRGAEDFIQKPYTFSSLSKTVSSLINGPERSDRYSAERVVRGQ